MLAIFVCCKFSKIKLYSKNLKYFLAAILLLVLASPHALSQNDRRSRRQRARGENTEISARDLQIDSLMLHRRDSVARADSLQVSVDYDGLLYNEQEPKAFGLKEVSLPAGEYYLRMGFKHSLTYSICIWFCGADETFGPDNCLVEDMSLIATGSNFHFDRGGAMEGLDFYGSESIGYPEYYDWRWWFDQDPEQYQKASAYDTDGYQVAIVNLKKSGNFKIKIASNDNAALYGNGRQDRTKSDVNQLMMYHWCLRPTIYNY